MVTAGTISKDPHDAISLIHFLVYLLVMSALLNMLFGTNC